MYHVIPKAFPQDFRQAVAHAYDGGAYVTLHGICKALLGMCMINQNLGGAAVLLQGHVHGKQGAGIQKITADIRVTFYYIEIVFQKIKIGELCGTVFPSLHGGF